LGHGHVISPEKTVDEKDAGKRSQGMKKKNKVKMAKDSKIP
jgi:hypothetical protein